jgi:5-methylcytosine-specific restriction endonuclease McrA
MIDRRFNQQQKKQRLIENNHTCDMCETPVTISASILHHEVPVVMNPLMVVDDVNLWVFCKECHRKTHSLPDCSFYELQNRKRCNDDKDVYVH